MAESRSGKLYSTGSSEMSNIAARADVEIISPEKLRKEFADKYRNALSLYKDC